MKVFNSVEFNLKFQYFISTDGGDVMAVWFSGNGVAQINEVTLRQAGLVLRWVTFRGCTVSVFNQPSRPTQPGHSSVGRRKCVLAMVTATVSEETASSA